MEPSLDVRRYNGCIIGGVQFYTLKYDSRCTTQNSGVIVIGESNASGSGDNNFYGVLNEVLHVQYPIGRSVWLFKYRWYLSSFSSGFEETYQMFLEFDEDLNTAGGWVEVGREYIEFVKGDLQEFMSDYHKHFKKYSDLEQTCANPLHMCVRRMEAWHFFCNHYISRAFQVRRPGYSKDLGRGPKPKSHKTMTSASSFLTCICNPKKDIRDVDFTSGTNAEAHRRNELRIERTMIPMVPSV
ncbi:CACTA en-spm transposon protein [Cucumis melo var. makuwa]|uniref:CACTA en-spm transposon protein n=1 Tax=Cucumis melo var. makuwa TaxID=1194695 RepID=A0A5D3CGD8_CUCMM|nr:CACTA en-spm transposon protein [Cucumis melo var. makuwa]